MGTIKKLYKNGLPDAALRFGLFTTRNLLQRETVRSAVRGQVRTTDEGLLLTASEMVPQ